MSAKHYASEDGEYTLCISVLGQTVVHFDWALYKGEELLKFAEEPARFYPFVSFPIMQQCMDIARATGIEFKMGYNNALPCDCFED